MKKTLAMLLAVMMLLSTTAFATSYDSITNGTAAWDDDGTVDGQDIDVSVPVRYNDDDEFGAEGEAATEIWLQVDATGQIDVTVPLVLVFQTNIDGGEATSPSDYKIINHSSADLVVTKIQTTEVAFDAEKQPMTMISYTGTPTEDQYAAQISGVSGVQGKYGAATYDLKNADFQAAAVFGGLFELEKAPANDYATGTVTNLAVNMKTGRLSFVTGVDEHGNQDAKKGIQLLTITYTVAIDTSDSFGDDITTDTNKTDSDRILNSNLADDADTHTRIGEVTTSTATEYNAD